MPNILKYQKQYDYEYKDDLSNLIHNLANDFAAYFILNIKNNAEIVNMHKNIENELKKIDNCNDIIFGKKLPKYEKPSKEGLSEKEYNRKIILTKREFDKQLKNEKYKYGEGKVHWQQFYEFYEAHKDLISEKIMKSVFNSKELSKCSAFDLFWDMYRTKLSVLAQLLGNKIGHLKNMQISSVKDNLMMEKIKAINLIKSTMDEKKELISNIKPMYCNFENAITDLYNKVLKEFINKNGKLQNDLLLNSSKEQALNNYYNFISFNNNENITLPNSLKIENLQNTALQELIIIYRNNDNKLIDIHKNLTEYKKAL